MPQPQVSYTVQTVQHSNITRCYLWPICPSTRLLKE